MTGLSRRAVLGAGAVAALTGCSTDDPEPPSGTTTTAPPGSPAEVVLLCRDTWNALPAAGPGTPHLVERLTVHHSAYPLHDNSAATAQIRRLQDEQLADGFDDIAYHRLIDLDGRVYEGRDPDTVGATYTQYDPTGHFLVCLLGHFDEQPLGSAQEISLAGLLAWAADHYGVGAETIAGHNHYDPVTPCPGLAVSAVLEDGSLTEQVDALLRRGTPVLRTQCRSSPESH